MNAFHHIRSFYPFVGQGVMELDEDSETSTYGLQDRRSAAELIQHIVE